ncbi:MAG: CpaF family protein, partial [Pseudomonadota bacterium]
MATGGFGKRSAIAGRAPEGFGQAKPTAAGARSLISMVESANRQPAETPSPPRGRSTENCVWDLHELIAPQLGDLFPRDQTRAKPRGELAARMEEHVKRLAKSEGRELDDAQLRDTVTVLLNQLINQIGGLEPQAAAKKTAASAASAKSVIAAKEHVQPLLMERIDASVIAEMERGDLAEQVSDVISEILVQEKMSLNTNEQRDLVTLLLNDMLGLGPLEPLLNDDDVTEIMVNGPKTIYIEKSGKLTVSGVEFRDDAHLL